MPSFAEILDSDTSSIEAPKPLPTGSYLCMVKGLPEYGKSSKKQTDFVKFNLQPLEALEDVDAEALEEAGGIANTSLPYYFYDSEWFGINIKKFLQDCGIDEGGSVRSLVERTPGCQVIVTLKHSARQDGQGLRAEISGSAAVGE